MPLIVNLRHLAAHEVRLKGELPLAELDIDPRDEVIRLEQPLRHDLEVQKLEGGLLVQGRLRLLIECRCVRCLKVFDRILDLPNWTCHVPLEGEEAAAVINDCVDLTAFVREDILLALPQHPLCEPGCGGLPKRHFGEPEKAGEAAHGETDASAWAELNKLKF